MYYFRNSLRLQRSFLLGLFAMGVFFLMPQGIMAIEIAPAQKVVVSGTIEVEAQSYREKFKDTNKSTKNDSDVTLATLELGIDAEINPSVQGHVLLLWEEDETDDISDLLDEGTITISNPEKCNYYLTTGKMYIPFGYFGSNFITDPMTLELGEINETAIQIGYQKGITDISFGFFNGDIKKIDKDDEINSFFANASVAYSQGPYNMNLGVSYLSNMADTDTLEGFMYPNGINEYVQGMGTFLRADMETLYISAEYLLTTENFDPGHFDPNLSIAYHLRPETYNLEFGLKTKDNAFLALKYEKSDDMNFIDLPEERYGICLSYTLYEDVSLSLEYLREKYKKVNTDKDKNDIVTAQLAVCF